MVTVSTMTSITVPLDCIVVTVVRLQVPVVVSRVFVRVLVRTVRVPVPVINGTEDVLVSVLSVVVVKGQDVMV